MNKDCKSFVQIPLEEYEKLKMESDTLCQVMETDKVIAVSIDWGCYNQQRKYIFNPTPDLLELRDQLNKNWERSDKDWISKHNTRLQKRITPFQIGKKIIDLL